MTGKKIGSATITVSYTEEGVTKSAAKKIKVTKGLQSVSISGAASVAYKGKTTFTAKVKFTDGRTATVTPTWSSSNPGVAAVSSKGVVSGVKGGSADITASYTYGGVTKSAKKTIKVTKTLTGISISGASSVYAGAKITLTATAKFNDGSTAKVTPKWKSSSKDATISAKGVVTGKKAGTVTITASYTYNGSSKVTKSGTKKIAVKRQLKSLAITGGGASVYVGKSLKFTLKATFTDGSTANVAAKKWAVSDKNIASVSASGTLGGKKDGSVKLTATYSYDGVTLSKSKTVAVEKQLKSLAISGSGAIAKGKTSALVAKATYTDGSTATVKPKWSSANTKVATVSAAGVVTGKKAGSTTVRAAYSYEGVSKTVSKKITVK